MGLREFYEIFLWVLIGGVVAMVVTPVLFALVVCTVSRFETLWVVPYSYESAGDGETPPEFLTQTCESLDSQDLPCVLRCGDKRGKMYRLWYAIYESANGESLIIISAGRILNLIVEGVEVFSSAGETSDRGMMTVSHPALLEVSPSIDHLLHQTEDPLELLEVHSARLGDWPVEGRPVGRLSELLHVRRHAADSLVRDGRAVWLDPGRNQYRMTFKGALQRLVRQRTDIAASLPSASSG